MATVAKVTPPENDDRKRMRSPAYPYINLETAIKRAKEFYAEEQRNAAPLKVAVKHWGYEAKSSGGAQTAAALISFGLLRDEGTGDKRKVKLTENALRIVLDTRADSEDRADAIRTAALTPKIHQQLWRKWENNIPSTENLKHILVLDWQPPFNPAAVDGFIKEYKDTIAFAKPDASVTVPLADGDTTPELEEDDGGGKNSSQGGYAPRVGDYVQWEPKGILQFREPKRIASISADGGYAFVDGSSTGVPVAELTKQQKPLEHAPAPLPNNRTMRQDIFSLAEGTVTIQWPTPLSADSIQDLKDWLKIVERKIARSEATTDEAKQP
jgi:hypothetical protein